MKLINRECLVQDIKHGGKELVAGRYIDNGRRIRLLTGEHSGEVLTHGFFKRISFIENRGHR